MGTCLGLLPTQDTRTDTKRRPIFKKKGFLEWKSLATLQTMSKRFPIRDRIQELRRVPARDLMPHPKNYRKHPERQKRLLSQLFGEIGYADALLAYETPEGRLQLIDGHLRA